MYGIQIGTIFLPEPSPPPRDTRSVEQKLHDAEALLRVWRESIMKFSADSHAENNRLRDALMPFAKLALTRKARDADDFDSIEVTMAHCRAAQKALAAD